MSSEFEDKLTIRNGFPIGNRPDRNSATPDLDNDIQFWREVGHDYAGGLSVAFDVFYDAGLNSGKHPQVACQNALDFVGIQYREDVFIYE